MNTDITATVELITPEIAKRMLENNIGNRGAKKNGISMMAYDIANGNWHENGESIKFDKNGILIDGQNRLFAVVQSGKAIRTVVVRGIEDVRGIDCGTKRTFGDYVKMGFSSLPDGLSCNFTSAIATFLLKMLYKPRQKFSNDEIYEMIIVHKDALLLANKIYGGGTRGIGSKKGIFRAGIWAAIVLAYENGYNVELLKEFCEVLVTGETINERMLPVIRLRNKMQSIVGTGGGMGFQLQKEQYMTTQHILKAVETANTKARPIAGANEYYKMR